MSQFTGYRYLTPSSFFGGQEVKVGEQMMEEAIQGMSRKQGVGGGSGWSPTVPFEDTHPVAPDPSP